MPATFDDFDSEIQSDELGECYDGLCGHCGTDHSDPGYEWGCLESQAEEFDDDDNEDGYNPYMGCRDDDGDFGMDG